MAPLWIAGDIMTQSVSPMLNGCGTLQGNRQSAEFQRIGTGGVSAQPSRQDANVSLTRVEPNDIAACHGPNAEGIGETPRLGGLSYHYLKRRLEQWSKESIQLQSFPASFPAASIALN